MLFTEEIFIVLHESDEHMNCSVCGADEFRNDKMCGLYGYFRGWSLQSSGCLRSDSARYM